jgi:hypothetical protein
MAIRPKSKIKIAEFKFDNQPTDTIKTNVMAGTLRAVSGQIGKGQPDNVKYEANTATIGIRGTDIELAIIPEVPRIEQASITMSMQEKYKWL